MKALIEMADVAAHNHIMGGSFKRNSLLKPLDIILDNLEKEPKDDIRDVVRVASIEQIDEHINRVTRAEFRLGREKREQKRDRIAEYVNLFFHGVLDTHHRRDVNRLLGRKRLLRSAYLIYFRNALSPKEKEQMDLEQTAEAEGTDLNTEE